MNHGLHIRPFGFDRVFAPTTLEATPTSTPEELLLKIAALEAELALARDDQDAAVALARVQGYEDGLADTRMTQEAALVAAVDAVQATLERVEAGLETIATDASTSVADAALTAAEYLAARAIEDAPCAAIDAAITRVLAQVARGQELQIAVAPSLVGEMERLIAARQAGDRRRLALTVIADPSIVPGDAHIHWDQGGVLLDAAARRALLIETLQGDIR